MSVNSEILNMTYPNKHKPLFCNENPADFYFDTKNYLAGEVVHNGGTNINYLWKLKHKELI